MIILNIMHMFDPFRRSPSGDSGAAHPNGTHERDTRGVASWVSSFFHMVGLDRLYTPPPQAPPVTPSPSSDIKSVALAFLKEIRPLIERGQLLDLAERLHTEQKAFASNGPSALSPSAHGADIGSDKESPAKHHITKQLATKFLAHMPDWLTEETDHFSDVAQRYAAEWAPYLKGSAAGAPLAGNISRFGAIASLIDAYMIDEFPTGLLVVQAAHFDGIPAVLATRHHTRGGWAVPGLAELSRRSGALNGVIASHDPSTPCPAEDADIFWERSKDSPEIWARCFERLLQKGLKPDSSIILVVDDNLSQKVKSAVREGLSSTIVKAKERDPHTPHKYLLAFCGSIAPALRAIKNHRVAGVLSDLFSPVPPVESARQKFRSYFKQTCSVLGIPPEANMDGMLERLDQDKVAAHQAVVRVYNRALKACSKNNPNASPGPSSVPASES